MIILALNNNVDFGKFIFGLKKRIINKINITHIYIAIIFLALSVRAFNINYNSAFSDEAVYIVVGKLGIFQRDWWSYHASSWMGGSQYFYPVMTSIAYVTGGISGSRLLNVIFGVLSVEIILRITTLLYNRNSKNGLLAGIIGAFIISTAAPAIYTSRLATYDMPAFYFTLLGFYFLMLEEVDSKKNYGRNYFLSALFIILGLLTKLIVILYLPFIFLYSYLRAKTISTKQRNKNNKIYFWKRYFIPTLFFGLFFYVVTNLSALLTFFDTQITREKVTYENVMITFTSGLLPTLILYFIATLGLLNKKWFKFWLALTTLSAITLIFHLATRRYDALDKHVFMSLCFLALGIGFGFTNLYNNLSIPKYFKYGLLFIILIFYSTYSVFQANTNYNLWKNSDNLSMFLKNNIHENSVVLAENGPEVILATYDINFPTNTITFDYINYKNKVDLSAYNEAVKDGYFEFIQVENERNTTTGRHETIYEGVKEEIQENYSLSYKDEDFSVYKRNY